ncbi:hypothetical protein SAMN06297164_2069 [Nitrosomonas ureae]|uniref:Uncharacterized protein n=1 Tax=Nitrosomonas ureae TaxID=44577 RepID=A0A286AB33_9PROT|nr:hypothetical protein SAMN06297164_2069 [Nitrosomonas ureae]
MYTMSNYLTQQPTPLVNRTAQSCALDSLRATHSGNGYSKRYAETCTYSTEVHVIFDNQDLIIYISFVPMRIQDSRCFTRLTFEKLIRKHCEDRSKKLVFRSHVGKIMPAIHSSLLQTA